MQGADCGTRLSSPPTRQAVDQTTCEGIADGWRWSMSEPPVGGGARVGNVGAIGAVRMVRLRCWPSRGWCSAIRVIAWCTARVTPARARSDADAARRSRPPNPNARQLSNQEVALDASLGGPLGVTDGTGLLDIVVDLGEASAVGVLGVGVEALARVAECRARQAGRVAAVYLGHHRRSRRRPDPARGTPGRHRRGAARGIVCPWGRALAPCAPRTQPTSSHPRDKDVEGCHRLLVACVVVLHLYWWGHRRRGLDPFEDRAGRQAPPRGARAPLVGRPPRWPGRRGLDWETCQAVIDEHVPGGIAQTVKDADTSSASSSQPSAPGHLVPSKRPPFSSRCCRSSAPKRCSCSSKVGPAPLLVPAGPGLHHRGCRPSPAHPASPTRRSSDGRVPGLEPDDRHLMPGPILGASTAAANRGFSRG
jgi:hypothetical protein